MAKPGRLADGGSIDRTRPLQFTFDGRRHRGYEGDTLASALLANGCRVVGRSFKYHRPRGIMSAGVEEPNALVRVGEGADAVPNLRATRIRLYDGLTARSQNCWPSVNFDLGAAAEIAGKWLQAGFYYKTFMWPRGSWKFYEKLIRRAAGLGRPPVGADSAAYGHRHAHCDVLVIGGGAAGLAASIAASRTGARVMLCDDGVRPGGNLVWESAKIDGARARDWALSVSEELRRQDNVTMLDRATAIACHDHNLVLVEQEPGKSAQRRLWKIRARQIVLAAGAVERPVIFPGNDRPGIMLLSAVRNYIRHYAVRPGGRAVIVTNNDSAYGAIAGLEAAGIALAAVIDLRSDPSDAARTMVGDGTPLLHGHGIFSTQGRGGLRSVTVGPEPGQAGDIRRIDCDILCMSGGWTPSIQLYSQHRGKLEYDAEIGALVPADPATPLRVVGAAAGAFMLESCLAEGADAGRAAAADTGFGPEQQGGGYDVASNELAGSPANVMMSPRSLLDARQKSFVDFQNDVVVKDIALSVGEGFEHIEHLKRYTTTGMGTDQGKTSQMNAIALVARLTERQESELGHTTYRPPYTPASFGAIAGMAKGALLAPIRYTPFHRSSEDAGAVFVTAGSWLYPRYYPRGGETMAQAIEREVRNTRANLGVVDMSSLGKVDLQGADALTFLERVYCNNLATLTVGRVRYSLLLREDGVLLDDGTVTRLGEQHYLLTLTTAHGWRGWLHLEKMRQVHWPDLDVRMASVTDHWASLAVAGPQARNLLTGLEPDFAVGNDALPFASFREGVVAGLPARVFRVSFSGELSYEINVPSGFAGDLWGRVMEAGEPLGIMPYGLEALDVMRIEKGHVAVGTEIDGRATAGDLGLGGMVSKTKDFVGRALLQRPAFSAPGRQQFVGLRPVDGKSPVPVAAQIAGAPWHGKAQKSLGHVTASVFSFAQGLPIAIAMVEDGRDRMGESLWAVSPVSNESTEVEISSPVFHDPEGVRLRG